MMIRTGEQERGLVCPILACTNPEVRLMLLLKTESGRDHA